MSIAVCIGCGCDDNHACADVCWWLRVDRKADLGVCSGCEPHVEAWDRGDRTPHAQPMAEIEAELFAEIRIPMPEQPRPPGGCYQPGRPRANHDWPFEDVQDADACRWCGMSFVRHIFTECP